MGDETTSCVKCSLLVNVGDTEPLALQTEVRYQHHQRLQGRGLGGDNLDLSQCPTVGGSKLGGGSGVNRT